MWHEPASPPLLTDAALAHCARLSMQVWSTEEEKVEAEEVMKTINERKPSDL